MSKQVRGDNKKAQSRDGQLIEQSSFEYRNFPTPEDCKGYEEVLPGMTDRMLTSTEQEAHIRHSQSQQYLDMEQKRLGLVGRSFWFATFALVCILAVVVYFVYMGHPQYGATFGGAVLAAVVLGFIYKTQKNKSQESE